MKRSEKNRQAAPVESDPRWSQVLARDSRADRLFWYSVLTTGVYCRPSCPSRLPNSKNVQLHETQAAAERAGFRPCKRCRPTEVGLVQEDLARVEKACRLIDQSEEEPSLESLAKAVGRSPSHFHRMFKAMTGITPKAYAASRRASRVREGLEKGSAVTSAIYDAGFGSSSRFYERSTEMLGMTPSRFRSGGAGEEIHFAVGESSLGAVLVASTPKGVAAILLGKDPEALVRELQDRFPRARLFGDDSDYESLVARVVGFIESPATGLDLPLDVRGTAFQRKVWQALRGIPVGQTLSYTELAERVGAPRAVRAVASACAANHIALAIPCHRVVRQDRSLSGYAWGIERKRSLIQRESTAGKKESEAQALGDKVGHP